MEFENKKRPDRVASLIQEELSQLLHREIEFPAGVLITIVSVYVHKKMSRALVGVSVYPKEHIEGAIRRLERATGYLGGLLRKKLNIKPMPEIMFRLDRGFENAAEVERALLHGENGAE